jgi:small subunit ribosomal protein S20
MAHSVSARKRIRQNATRRRRNAALKSRFRSQMKKALQTAREKKGPEAAKELAKAYKFIDKAAKTNVIHKNAAARHKSRLARRIAAALHAAKA